MRHNIVFLFEAEPNALILSWERKATSLTGLIQMQQQRAANALAAQSDQVTAAQIPKEAELPQYA